MLNEEKFLGLVGIVDETTRNIFLPLQAITTCEAIGNPDDKDGIKVKACLGRECYTLVAAEVKTFTEYMEEEYAFSG